MGGRLTGKTSLIVGATSGMGRATAQQFAREGARVAVAGRRAEQLAELAAHVRAESGVEATTLVCDARRREDIAALVEGAVAALGRIDSVIYATGTNLPEREIHRLSPDAWDDLIATNLTGAYHLTQLILPALRAQGGGLLIYISSIAAWRPDQSGVSGVAYTASKCGLDGLAYGVREEEKQNGIRTSVIYPGLTFTPLVYQRPTPPSEEVLSKALLPEDVAEACLYVASQPARCHIPSLVLYPAAM